MSAINELTRRGKGARKTGAGSNSIPGLWRGTIVRVDGTLAWVRIPRLSGSDAHGPCPMIPATAVVGDRVLVGAIEGRVEDLIVMAVL